jgi:hypothetical protein|uniref:PorV/PorQ family protein n=1 Tax=candidate division WOR-3 bacterium TaxID=2052148 RepID=A0A7V3RGE6_UNCW3
MTLLFLVTITGFEYLIVDPVAERVSMGYGLYGDGHNIHYNPAGIALNTGTSYSFSYLNYIGGTHFGYVDYENKVFGAGIRYFYSGKMKKTDALGQEYGDFSSNFIDLNVGRGFLIKNIILGTSGKMVYELIDTLYSLGLGVDLGGMYTLTQENINLGFTIKNIGTCVKPFISERELLPYELNISGVYKFNTGWLGMDIVKPALMNLGFRIGGGYDISNLFSLRLSYNSLLSQVKMNSGLDFLAGITIGFGIKKGKLKVNYSYTPFFNLGHSNRLTIRIGG